MYINVLPIELPGRGARFEESLLVDANLMSDDLLEQLKNYTNIPYIIWGHSMGSLLGYLVAKKISDNNLPLPLFLIVTGCEGPSVKGKYQKLRSNLPSDQFIEELKKLGGIPEEVLKDKSFVDIFEPILRADFKAIESYEYRKSNPLNVPICVMYGSEENISLEEAASWQEESNFEVEIFEFSGDHFFIFNHEKQILDIIERKIKQQRKVLTL